jgi:uncharacterized membrane protein YecN with MAPEG domain
MRTPAAHTKTNGPAKATTAMVHVRRIGLTAVSGRVVESWRVIAASFILRRVGIQFKTTVLLVLVAPNRYAASEPRRDFRYWSTVRD